MSSNSLKKGKGSDALCYLPAFILILVIILVVLTWKGISVSSIF